MTAILSAIFAIHRRSLMWTVLRIVRDPNTAEDLAQETYLKVHKALEAKPIDNLESYLYQTARNLALDHKRKLKFREQFEDIERDESGIADVASDEISAEEKILERERQRIFEVALAELPLRSRQAWSLSQIDGWTYQEIADHIGVSRNTVYNDVKLVLGHCREALSKFEKG
ncbi:RNA polymerase sigma factor [Agrobacterium sp. AGB01]|uniref:RNA polymerase sigma factor n=1 Tax=Agrobacterium sp. AGB01 TaxID=2769302 RepID=UPI001780628C|nr:RNA polymerase sigma factor [Agrobacterium sp. AGB01]MBD9389661.1 RNA polymerase sigma factor [Agrobacterium sp. AGB01]